MAKTGDLFPHGAPVAALLIPMMFDGEVGGGGGNEGWSDTGVGGPRLEELGRSGLTGKAVRGGTHQLKGNDGDGVDRWWR
jgi:hypothetical protein